MKIMINLPKILIWPIIVYSLRFDAVAASPDQINPNTITALSFHNFINFPLMPVKINTCLTLPKKEKQLGNYTLYNVCSVHRGMFSTWGLFGTSGDTMSTSGDIMSILGGGGNLNISQCTHNFPRCTHGIPLMY